MHIALAGGALVALDGVAILVNIATLVEVRELGLDALADLHNREVRRGLQDRAGDDVADTARELLVDLLTGRVAHDGVDLGLSMLGRSARRPLGRHVTLRELGVLVGLLVIGLFDGNELVYVDPARCAVDGDLGAERQMQQIGIALSEGLLETIEQVQLIDMLLLAQLHQRFHHLGRHLTFSLPSSP